MGIKVPVASREDDLGETVEQGVEEGLTPRGGQDPETGPSNLPTLAGKSPIPH